MGNCVFTIVAKNYIGLAQILEQSIKQYYKNLEFFIVVADELMEDVVYPDNIIEAKNKIGIPIDLWYNMAFKYDLTEFCTSIKPASFIYFLNKYEKVIYLDPDILFYDSIEAVYKLLDDCSMLLTPHITQIALEPRSDSPENVWLSCGIFNLGFCAVKKTVKVLELMKWWHRRLEVACFNDRLDSTFTDQIWMNFAPALLSSKELHIVYDLGFNIAPWNFFERKILFEDGKYYVVSRFRKDMINKEHLLFVHYSGYNYKALLNSHIVQNNVSALYDYEDIRLIMDVYAKHLQRNKSLFLKFINQRYTYNYFDNGTEIQLLHRRMYRALIMKKENINNPFCTSDVFYKMLKNRKLLPSNCYNVEKISREERQQMKQSSRLLILNKMSRLCFRLIGYNRYLLLLKFFRLFSRYEAQIHLLHHKYDLINLDFQQFEKSLSRLNKYRDEKS